MLSAVIEKKNEILTETAAAMMLFFVIAGFLSAADNGGVIPFALAAPAFFLLLHYINTKLEEKKRLILAGALALVFVVALIALHRYIGSGAAGIMNDLFESGESSRDYIYKRYDNAEGLSDASPAIAVIWSSAILGTVMAMIPKWSTIWGCLILFITGSIFFAYYGIEPSALWLLLTMGTFFVLLTGDSLISIWPLILAALLIAGAVLLINPGESEAISKADEAIRDKFAINTVAYEGEDMSETEEEEEQEEGGGGSDQEEPDSEDEKPLVRKALIVAGLVLITLLILFVPAIIHDRLERKRKRNREGLESEDNAVAVRSMFIYAVRWLNAGGLKLRNVPYDDYREDIRAITADRYTENYSEMLDLWKEAAYSSHRIGNNEREAMKGFMDSTIKMVQDKADLKSKFKIKFRLAL